MSCPICGSRFFGDFRGRRGVMCNGCQSLERHRIFALFTIEMMPALQGRRVHILAPGRTFQPVPLIAPELFVFSTPAEILEAERIDALYLAFQFDAFDLRIEPLFAELRKRVPSDGIVAFMHNVANGVDVYAEREGVGADGKPVTEQLFGPRGIEWFAKLPDWTTTLWNPEDNFGPEANETMVLRYAPELATHNRLLVARPAEVAAPRRRRRAASNR